MNENEQKPEECSFCESPVDPKRPETFLIRDGVTNKLVCPACYSSAE